MKDIRLIATDLDGTLLDRDGFIRPYTRRTLAQCLERGITVMLVSGRCHNTARMPAVQARLDLVVASSNGARIDKTPYGPTIYERLMNKEECAAVYDILRDCPGNIYSYVRGINFGRLCDTDSGEKRIRIDGLPDDPLQWIYNDVERMEAEALDNVHKFEIYDKRPELLAEYGRRLTAIGMAVTSSNPEDIEIQPMDSSKGMAVRKMAQLLGIGKEQIMCFGDNTNDSSMLEEAGIGVAMANAVPELRATADYIAPPNCFEGEARTIRRLVFGEQDIWPEMMG
ncbi:MAG: HAD family hydrolase [Eubacteriales bacterium]|nr:HAD family hydrolase [Eubacteriales bacterium]